MLGVKSLYLYELGLFMFKFNNSLLPANFKKYYKSVKNVHNYHTRSSENNFLLPRFNSKMGHKSQSYHGSKLWTKSPHYVQNI